MKFQKSFTFIETLIVIGIIAILASAVVVMVNPTRRFESARDKQREIHLQSILSAIYQHRVIKGYDCLDMPDSTEIIEENGEEKEIPVFKTIGIRRDPDNPEEIHPDYYDLYHCLVPIYLAEALYDPAEGSTEDSKYKIWQNPYSKRVTLVYDEIFAGPEEHWILSRPEVSTSVVTNISHTRALVGGNIIKDGGAPVWERGVIWAATEDIDVPEDQLKLDLVDMNTIFRKTMGSGTGSFSDNLTGLNYDTEYYVRAYGRNDIGVGYGLPRTFETPDLKPVIKTLSAINITPIGAQIRGEVLESGSEFGYPLSDAYFCLGKNEAEAENWAIQGNCSDDNRLAAYVPGLGDGDIFYFDLDNLDNQTNYYFVACAENYWGIGCGKVEGFYTDDGPPVVATYMPEDREPYTATAVGRVVHDGGLAVSKWGFCLSAFGEPSYSPSECLEYSTADPGEMLETGDFFFGGLSGLEPGTEYKIFAFAENGKGMSRGQTIKFSAKIGNPEVTTQLDYPGGHSAKLGVRITRDGGAPIIEHRICWGPSEQEVTQRCLSREGGHIGVFEFPLWYFLGQKAYYVQAFAVNKELKEGKGSIRSFTTDDYRAPVLGETKVLDKERNTATVEGVITSAGGLARIDKYGFCWSSNEIRPAQPDATPPHDGGCTTPRSAHLEVSEERFWPFIDEIDGLLMGGEYYVQAYAQNEQGFGFGSPIKFKTDDPEPPSVQTHQIDPATIIGTEATAGGKLLDDGGESLTTVGVCYSRVSAYPSLGQDPCPVAYDRDLDGVFTVQLTGLVGGENYRYRAYAWNNAGAAYGARYEFMAGSINGVPCTDKQECRSGHCVDGYCCNSICDEVCMACNVVNKEGSCSSVPAQTVDPGCEQIAGLLSCDGTCKIVQTQNYCDGQGACHRAFYQNVVSGKVCVGQGQTVAEVELPVSDQPGHYCQLFYDCGGPGDVRCSGHLRYTSCKGDGHCHTHPDFDQNHLAVPVTAKQGYTLTSQCGTEGLAVCGNSEWECTGPCWRERYNLVCDAEHQCQQKRGSAVPFSISVGYVCVEGYEAKPDTLNNCGKNEKLECASGSCYDFTFGHYFACAANGVCRDPNQVEWDPEIDGGFEAHNYAEANYILTAECENSQNMAQASPCQWCQGEPETESAYKFFDKRDGKTYNTVWIDQQQCWMAQNMNIGTQVSGITTQGDSCEAIQKYCYADNSASCTSDNPNNPDGGLYQWHQAMCEGGTQDICPAGWRISNHSDWEALLGSWTPWTGTQLQPNGASGFEGNLAGHRNTLGEFLGRGDYTGFWTSHDYTDDTAWYWSLYQNDNNVYKLLFDKKGGFSVRCITD